MSTPSERNMEGRLESIVRCHDEEIKFFEDMVQNFQKREAELSELKLKLKHQTELVGIYYGKKETAESELKEQNELIGNHSFVSVLIDGDSLKFHDDFIKDPYGENNNIANRLIAEVKAYISREVVNVKPPYKIHIVVYCNLSGLATMYAQWIDKMPAGGFRAFVTRFNSINPSCHIVDAGNGKECADEKVKDMLHDLADTFESHLADVHCKHIIFGGPTDNGYARLLGRQVKSKGVNERITMLKGPPFVKELEALAPSFLTTSYPEIFRETDPKDPVGRRVSFSVPTPPQSPSLGPSTYASTAARGQNESDDTRAPVQQSSEERAPPAVLTNRAGQRVDARLQTVSQSLVIKVKSEKFCNNWHLGECNWQDCIHKHGPKLIGRDRIALQHVARQSPCTAGLDCEDPSCFSGHYCPWEPNCHHEDSCRFAGMHRRDIIKN